MRITHFQGIDDKATLFRRLLAERRIAPEETIFVGNDLNDLPVFPLAGWSVAVADAHQRVRRAADFVLSRRGGKGAVRELCDLILQKTRSFDQGDK